MRRAQQTMVDVLIAFSELGLRCQGCALGRSA